MIDLATNEIIETVAGAAGLPAPWASIDGSNCWTISNAEGPVALMGCQENWLGFAQAWGIVDYERAKGQGLWLARQVRQLLIDVAKDNGYRQIRSMCFSKRDSDWLKLLGFEMEGVWLEAGPEHQNVYTMVYHRRH